LFVDASGRVGVGATPASASFEVSQSGATSASDVLRIYNRTDGTSTGYLGFPKYGSAASAYGTTAEVYIQDIMLMPTNSAGANIYGAGVIDILDYANTNKFKTVRSLTGTDLNGSGQIILGSGLYQQTTAITSITLEANGVNWLTNSSFALYGIKG
jgi:hypothetical protein